MKMLRKLNYVKLCLAILVFGIGIISIIGSVGPSRSVKINDLLEPRYNPNFQHDIADREGKDSGYTIGIIDLEFIEKNPKGWTYSSPESRNGVKSTFDPCC